MCLYVDRQCLSYLFNPIVAILHVLTADNITLYTTCPCYYPYSKMFIKAKKWPFWASTRDNVESIITCER